MIHFDEHIFQMGWNHQLVFVSTKLFLKKNATFTGCLWWMPLGRFAPSGASGGPSAAAQRCLLWGGQRRTLPDRSRWGKLAGGGFGQNVCIAWVWSPPKLPGCQLSSFSLGFFMIFWFETHTYSFWGSFTVCGGRAPCIGFNPHHIHYSGHNQGITRFLGSVIPSLKNATVTGWGLNLICAKFVGVETFRQKTGLCLFLFGGWGRLLILANESWACAFHFWWVLKVDLRRHETMPWFSF